jgi:hypothetical protein
MTPPRLADKRVQHVQKNAGKEGSAPETKVNCKTAVKTLAQGTARHALNAMLDSSWWQRVQPARAVAGIRTAQIILR